MEQLFQNQLNEDLLTEQAKDRSKIIKNINKPKIYPIFDHASLLVNTINTKEKNIIIDDFNDYVKNFSLKLKQEREDSYLTNIPSSANNFGVSKVLAVRSEIIHIKHILTEIFVRRSIDIEKYLETLKLSLFDYMEIMTNRMRLVHKFSRSYTVHCPDDIVKNERNKFFPTIKLLNGLDVAIVLDFDGVTTDKSFGKLYEKCIDTANVHICSANPTITEDWFDKRGLTKPFKIHSMKGKVKKIKRLIELQKKHDYLFFVDNETKYLEYAWLFGLQTFHWDGRNIKYFSMNTK